MDLLWKEFLGLLEGETGLYRSLLSVLQEEKEAIVKSKLNELNEASKEKEYLILKIRKLEEQRLKVQRKLADSLGYPPEGLPLIELSQLVEEPYSTQLEDCRSNFLALTQSIKEANNANKSLLIHSLELVRGSVAFLDNLMASNTVYYRTGEIQNSGQSGKVFSGEI